MAAAAAATGRAFLISRSSDSYLKPPPAYSNHLLIRPLIPAIAATKRRTSAVVSCLISGVDGGGVSDDFVSTRKSGFDREFSVIASMLRRIEPLDNSVISKGVSDSAKDSMKQTISTMLGYTLWNVEYRLSLMRNFDISPNASKRLNFPEEDEASEAKHEGGEGGKVRIDGCAKDDERMNIQGLGDLSPEALDYIQQLETELSTVKHVRTLSLSLSLSLSHTHTLSLSLSLKYTRAQSHKLWTVYDVIMELFVSGLDPGNLRPLGWGKAAYQNLPKHLRSNMTNRRQELDVQINTDQEENMFQELQAQKQETVQMEHIRESNNDLLKYLRSLDSDMVMELSRPSSLEVDEVIHQLVQDILQGFFKEDTPSDIIWDSAIRGQENYVKINDEFCDTIGTSRDYLAKLLFWCMLLGHHLRGLENRVHLSCAVGLL
ncbi:hypothetical protein RJ639_009267 [Escallonia herrerae]|uniref:Uncharacterized protein n=1 Tax=Escallonia herrerae TaxID=1293975 RepID=A0AA88VRY0_9ASTE|nr:hypothetical protein RJ639_009267 [Escallonia herrerae]